MSDVAKELADALRFRDAVLKALPIDEEADAAAATALGRYHASRGPGRKLVKKLIDAAPPNDTPTPHGEGDL